MTHHLIRVENPKNVGLMGVENIMVFITVDEERRRVHEKAINDY